MSRRRQTPCTIPDHAATRIDGAELAAYDVLSELAHGGTATVYLGVDRATGEQVAIKALHAFYVGRSDMVLRLLGEHELVRRARHPGLLDIRCASYTGHGVPYLVMEYLDGESLGERVARTPMAASVILAIAAQIAAAAAALHAAGVIHCDLKPDNILVLRDVGPGGAPQVKVIDYGVAQLADEPPLDDGEVVGTPGFMAPEQWRGAPTTASDVYALGCVIYELFTGTPVFTGPLPQLMTAHCEHEPPRPSLRCPGIDPAVEQLIGRALAKSGAARPTMAALAGELTELAARTEPASASDAGARPPASTASAARAVYAALATMPAFA